MRGHSVQAHGPASVHKLDGPTHTPRGVDREQQVVGSEAVALRGVEGVEDVEKKA